MRLAAGTNKDIIVVYHKDCLDGFGSAWAAWKSFREKAVYLPVRPDPEDFLSRNFSQKEIYLIDVSFSADLIRGLSAAGNKITIIDHHQTTAGTMVLADQHSFDLQHSAAVLSWRYFQPRRPVPKLLLYVEDMDLWLFRLPQSRPLAAFLELVDHDFIFWNRLAADFERSDRRKKFAEKGKIFIEARKKIIEVLVANAEKIILDNHEALAVNSPFWFSEIGEAIYLREPHLGIIWARKGNFYKVSLRSDGSVDVASLAEKYGGGGHRQAAGFRWPADKPLPWRGID